MSILLNVKILKSGKVVRVMKNLKYPNIEAERARKGLTKNELAKELGICRKTYDNWVNKGKIPQKKIQHMAKFFCCSVDYLLESAVLY